MVTSLFLLYPEKNGSLGKESAQDDRTIPYLVYIYIYSSGVATQSVVTLIQVGWWIFFGVTLSFIDAKPPRNN